MTSCDMIPKTTRTKAGPEAGWDYRLLKRLSGRHDSKSTSPLIAGAFPRAGLIEKWGLGTNRVIEMCRKAGIRPPEFHEIAGSAVVKFRVPVGVTGQVTDQVERLLALLGNRPMTAAEIMRGLEMNHRSTLRDSYLHPALQAGLIFDDRARQAQQPVAEIPADAGRDESPGGQTQGNG